MLHSYFLLKLCPSFEALSRPRRDATKARGLPSPGIEPETLAEVPIELAEFRTVVLSGDIEKAMDAYTLLIGTRVMETEDSCLIARLVHNFFRSHRNMPKGSSEVLAGFVAEVVGNLEDGKLPCHPLTGLHLLSYYKDSQQFEKGEALWRWLEKQDEGCTDARTYGAAIEMLAHQGEPLEALESLYSRALQLFPGDFNEFHLSAQGVLSDPSKTTRFSTHITLLQGILTARILNDDWRNAYLALDTALRLHPNQVPARFFTLFMYKRPLQEAYKAFALACRSSTVIPNSSLNAMLNRMMESRRVAQASEENADDIVVAALNAVEAFVVAGGDLTGNKSYLVSEGILSLGRPPTIEGDAEQAEETSVVNAALLSAVRRLVGLELEREASPSPAAAHKMLSLATKISWKEAADMVTEMIDAVGAPTAITFRVLLNAAGQFQDFGSVQTRWQQFTTFLSQNDSTPRLPEFNDWKALIRASNKCGRTDFAKAAYLDFQPKMKWADRQLVEGELQAGLNSKPRFQKPGKHPTLVSTASEILVKVNSIKHWLREPPLTPEERFNMLEDVDFPFGSAQLSEEDSQLFYHKRYAPRGPPSKQEPDPPIDDFHSDLSEASASESPSTSTESPTPSLPPASLSLVRYTNWKTINELLLEAEIHQDNLANLEAQGKAGPNSVNRQLMHERLVPKTHPSRLREPASLQRLYEDAGAAVPNADTVTEAKILALRGGSVPPPL
ncbi:MAG: hypothetical protein M4579_000891 [Chaenotheca gracillima]|nr:MAG: hypothetical protein M4579_000891 [Chaenotheca gracillima]